MLPMHDEFIEKTAMKKHGFREYLSLLNKADPQHPFQLFNMEEFLRKSRGDFDLNEIRESPYFIY
jgi:hypothetical protein